MHLVMALLKLEALSNYHFIECFALGRFRIFTRTIHINQLLFLNFSIPFFLLREYLNRRSIRNGTASREKCRFHVIEFIMHSECEVMRNEMRYMNRYQRLMQQLRNEQPKCSAGHKKAAIEAALSWPPSSVTNTRATHRASLSNDQRQHEVGPTFDIQNEPSEFASESSMNHLHEIMRP